MNAPALTPQQRAASSRVRPASTRPVPTLQAELDAKAEEYRDSNHFLIWHGNPATGEYTGFSVGGELNKAEA